MVKEGEKSNFWWWIIILALIIFFYTNSEKDDYISCVSYCIEDHDFCVLDFTIYSTTLEGYISEYDYSDCFYELEDCSRNCER